MRGIIDDGAFGFRTLGINGSEADGSEHNFFAVVRPDKGGVVRGVIRPGDLDLKAKFHGRCVPEVHQ